MTTQTDLRPHTLWAKTVVVAKADRRAKHPTPTDRPAPTTQAAREKEADRWVAQMMFENYNS